MTGMLKRTGRLASILAVTGFVGVPALLLAACDDTSTSRRTTTKTTETPETKKVEKSETTVKETGKK